MLRSWAVPRGLPTDHRRDRLAVPVERPRARARDVRGRRQADRRHRLVGARGPQRPAVGVRAPRPHRPAPLRPHRHRRRRPAPPGQGAAGRHRVEPGHGPPPRRTHRPLARAAARAGLLRPGGRGRGDRLGVRKGRGAYFASRSAPMGRVGAGTVAATFYVFNPTLVAHFIPAAWEAAGPEDVVAARYRGVSAAWRRLLGEETLASAEVAEAAELARTAAAGCTVAGRPLYAGHADLAWPDEPHLVLFHALTLLREHRGDGHVAALTARRPQRPRVAAQPHRHRPRLHPDRRPGDPRLVRRGVVRRARRPGRPRPDDLRGGAHRRGPGRCASRWSPGPTTTAAPRGTSSASRAGAARGARPSRRSRRCGPRERSPTGSSPGVAEGQRGAPTGGVCCTGPDPGTADEVRVRIA